MFRFRRDEGEVSGSPPDRHVIADEPPAEPDPFDRVRYRHGDDGTQRLGSALDARREAAQEELRRDQLHRLMIHYGLALS
jgi:hypothetical protein